MTRYRLFAHTGPQRKATQVYVLDLVGCCLYRRTADDAIRDAPDEIRAYLSWLRRHGEDVDPDAPVDATVVEESHAGGFIGSAEVVSDVEPVTPREIERYARWLEWGREDLLALVEGLGAKALDAKPAQGRSVRSILEHVLGADKGYLYSGLGVTKSVGDPTNAALAGRMDLFEALRTARVAAIERIRRATAAERSRVRKGGRSTHTLRRSLRAMLSHEWQHRREIEARLGSRAARSPAGARGTARPARRGPSRTRGR
ncbi:MAG TPA: DinB family protein [Candidatus Limnocylindria bacterium]|nr:DinB family protein [Candidatus Limnocylindria bacterium]